MAVLAGTVVLSQLTFVAPPAEAVASAEPERFAGRVLVKLNGSDEVLSVRDAGMGIDQEINLLKSNPAVRIAEPDYVYHSAAVPNDPDYPKQQYLPAVGLPDAWNFAKGSSVITVAVLDTGVDLSHPDLRDRIWTNNGEIPGNGLDDDGDGYVDDVHGWNFVDNDNDPNPVVTTSGSTEGINHGTLVAGIIGAAGNNSLGVTGVNWSVKLMPLRVLDSQGNGGTQAVEKAVRYAVDHGAKVINISFSGAGYSQILAEALRDAYRAGVVIVAAAGNEGDTARGGNLNAYPEYPVCYRGVGNEPIVIGVASLDHAGARSTFTNFGSDCVTLSAPGEDYWTTQVYRPGVAGYDQPYGDGWSGSSLSAPLVAGVAALIASMNPGFTPAQIMNLLYSTADDISGANGPMSPQLGHGRLDAAAAVLAAQTYLLGGGQVSSQSVSKPISSVLPPSALSGYVALTSMSGGPASVSVFRANLREYAGFEAYRGRIDGLTVAPADVDGDGVQEMVVGAPPGEKPLVRVFTAEGALISQFAAFEQSFRGGVRVARIDLNGDGKDEIAALPGPGGAPKVRLFDSGGKLLSEFSVFGGKGRYGLRAAGIDLNGDGKEEILVANSGAVGAAKVYGKDGTEKLSIQPFDRSYYGGLEVAAGDVDGDGQPEIVLGAGPGGPPRIVVFDLAGRKEADFFAFDKNLRTGVALAVASFGNAQAKILAGTSGSGELRQLSGGGTLEKSFWPFGKSYWRGLRPAAYSLLRAGK